MGPGVLGGECPLGDNIYVNGAWIGVHRDAANLVKTLKRLRRRDDISTEVSVVRDVQERDEGVYGCGSSLQTIVHRGGPTARFAEEAHLMAQQLRR